MLPPAYNGGLRVFKTSRSVYFYFIFMLLSFLKDLLFPIVCLGCRREGAWLCPACFRTLRFGGSVSNDCRLATPTVDHLYIAGDYDDPLLAELIKKFKFNPTRELGPILGNFLALFWSGQLLLEPHLKKAVLVPIPLSKKRERWRGFNQASVLADELAAQLGLESCPGLTRVKNRRPQSTLSAKDRRRNLAQAFLWRGHSLAGQDLVLVDDVITTGATLEEAARTVKKAGAGKVYGLALAKG